MLCFMRKSLIISAFSMFLAGALSAQAPRYMKWIPGGSTTIGGGYQYETQGAYMYCIGRDAGFDALLRQGQVIGEVPDENNGDRRVTVAGFYLAETEVTNAQYRAFLLDSLFTETEEDALSSQMNAARKKDNRTNAEALSRLIEVAGAAGLLPDTACWNTDFVFAYNAPLVHNYLWHPAFDEYPVVGVTWQQASAYCAWLTASVNAELQAKGKAALPAFRLPTEVEWEYAARGRRPEEAPEWRGDYAWDSFDWFDKQGRPLANIKTHPGNYIGDNYEYTAPVRAFESNPFGLYQMGGNVAEWTLDVFTLMPAQNDQALAWVPQNPETDPAQMRVVKGGSWADYLYAARCGSRGAYDQNRGFSRVGFRVAMPGH